MGDTSKENKEHGRHEHGHHGGGHGHGHEDGHGHEHHGHDHGHHDDWHSHDHDHDHHDDGHDHDYEDGHDHDHEDGHDHDHERIGTDGGINVSHHEGALILSTQIVVAAAHSRMVKAVENALNELAAWVDAHDGITGHIKASVSENARSTTISNTGDGVALKEFAGDITTVSMASIVFSVPEHEYCEKFEEVVESLKNLSNKT